MANTSGIAGVKAPAFIERAEDVERFKRLGGIAGVKAPAFIERSAGGGGRRPNAPDCGGESPRLH